MIRVGYVIGILLLVPTGVFAQAQYRFTMPSVESQAVEITATLEVPRGRLRMVQVNIPEGVPLGFAALVDDLEIRNAAGENLSYTQNPDFPIWDLDEEPTGPVTIRYRLRLEHDRYAWPVGSNESAYTTDEMLFFTGQAAFIHSTYTGPIEVEFDIPEGWTLSTPWDTVGETGRTIRAPDFESLTRNCFTMGDYEALEIRDEETIITLVRGRAMAPVIARYESDLKTLLRGYRDLFGRGANTRFLMVINQANFDGAGAFPSSISIETTETAQGLGAEDEPKLLYLLAHETLHLWNGRSLQAAGQVEWFKEGFTDYYSWMMMYRSGQISKELLLRVLGNRISRYADAAGSISISMAGTRKSEFYEIVYYGGLTTALVLDLDIRSATGGKATLDDAMRALAEAFPEGGRGYRQRDVQAVVEELTGQSFDTLFGEHLMSDSGLPIIALLSDHGLTLDAETVKGVERKRLVLPDALSRKQQMVLDAWLERPGTK